VEVVLKQGRVGAIGTHYEAQEYYLSEHRHRRRMTPSEARLLPGTHHVMVAVAQGSHAMYPMCSHETAYPTEFDVLGILVVHDHVCAEHNSRRPELREAEPGLIEVGGQGLQPENLAAGDKERFACWNGLFGFQVGEGPLSFAYGTSPRTPLRQLDPALEAAGRACSVPVPT
jgi:hypothetical protein